MGNSFDNHLDTMLGDTDPTTTTKKEGDSSGTDLDLRTPFQKLKAYILSHERLGEKVSRRATLQDEGSRNDTGLRKTARAAAYFLPALLTSPRHIPVIGTIGGFILEDMPREAMGYGSARAQQAKDLYHQLEVFLGKESEEEEEVFFRAFKSSYHGHHSLGKDPETLFKTLFDSLEQKNNLPLFGEWELKRWSVIQALCGKSRSHFSGCTDADILKNELIKEFKEQRYSNAVDIVEKRIKENGWTYGESKVLLPIAESCLGSIEFRPSRVTVKKDLPQSVDSSAGGFGFAEDESETVERGQLNREKAGLFKPVGATKNPVDSDEEEAKEEQVEQEQEKTPSRSPSNQ